MGVSNSPLPPSGPAMTVGAPSAAGISTAGMSCTRVSRHGRGVDQLPTLTRPRTAIATSSTHSRAVQAGLKFHLSCSSAVSIDGALSSRSSSATGLSFRSSRGILGRPSVAAISATVSSPDAARFTGPLPTPESKAARTNTRCASSLCTTCREPLPAGKNAEAKARRTQLSTPRPRIADERIATHSAPLAAIISSARALSRPNAETGCSGSASELRRRSGP